MENFDLFSQAAMEFEPVKNSLGVYKDGQFVNMEWPELFDNKRYNCLIAVAYVSSVQFFVNLTKDFDKVCFILGIKDADFKAAFGESLRARISDDGTGFFESLPDDFKGRIVDDRIEVKYSNPDCLIHSKIYLLSNDKTGEKRVILGSANLTDAALNRNIMHFEDIQVYDDEKVYDCYLQRVEEIKNNTMDYIPETVKKKYKEGNLINLADFTTEEKTNQLLDILQTQNIVPICTEEFIQDIQEDISYKQKEVEQLQATLSIVTSSGKKSKKGDYYELKAITEVRQKLTDLLFKTTRSEEALVRFTLTYNDADKKQYRVFPSNEENEVTRSMEVFDRKATKEEIKQSLNNILNFISAYKELTNNPDPTEMNLSHIFEIILYSFASAYIFKLREENPGRRADFPIMLVIGGRAASGKSNLLAFIDGLLSGRMLETNNHFIQYKDIERSNTLRNLYLSENTYPLLVDEMSAKFFSSKAQNKGEELLKYLANTLEGKHPVTICTTNTTAFHIPAQVERRIYYLQVNDCFDKSKKGTADEFYEQIMNNTNNDLFKDFCYRVGEKVKAGEYLTTAGNSDYLQFVREIFKEYFKEAEMDLPAYFPNNIFRDYELRGQNMWKTLFEKRPHEFTHDKKYKTLSISGKCMDDKELYMDYLRPDLLVEDTGEFIIVRRDEFFTWIGINGAMKRYRALRNVSKQKI